MSLLEWLKIWSKILQFTPILQYRIPPPPPKMKIVRNLGTLTFQLQNTPPPPRKLKFRQILALWLFSCRIPPPPQNWNLGRSWHFVIFQLQNTPPQIEIYADLGTLTFQLQNTPPQNWNLGRSWHFVIFQLQNTPPPKLKFMQILALWLFSCRIPPLPPKIEI